MEHGEQKSKEELIAMVADLWGEIGRLGPYAIPPEWFTLRLSAAQLRAMFLLLEEEALRMSDLASALDITFSGATGLVDRMVEKELVERWAHAEDRRAVMCGLTEQGRSLGERLLAERRSRWEERLVHLSQAELVKVNKAMELLHKAAQMAAVSRKREPVSTEASTG